MEAVSSRAATASSRAMAATASSDGDSEMARWWLIHLEALLLTAPGARRPTPPDPLRDHLEKVILLADVGQVGHGVHVGRLLGCLGQAHDAFGAIVVAYFSQNQPFKSPLGAISAVFSLNFVRLVCRK